MDQEMNMGAEELMESRMGFKGVMGRLWRENKLAVFSAVLILILVLGALLAPWLTPYGYEQIDAVNRLDGPSSSGHGRAGTGCTNPNALWIPDLSAGGHRSHGHFHAGGGGAGNPCRI